MISRHDQRSIHRYVDGQMDAAERERFESRLQREQELHDAVDATRAGSVALREAAAEPMRAPATFAAGVLQQVRHLPSRDELVQITDAEEAHAASVELAIAHGRRLLVAAVVVFGLSMLFCMGLLRRDAEELSAKPAEDQKLMKQLDAKASQGDCLASRSTPWLAVAGSRIPPSSTTCVTSMRSRSGFSPSSLRATASWRSGSAELSGWSFSRVSMDSSPVRRTTFFICGDRATASCLEPATPSSTRSRRPDSSRRRSIV